MAAKVFISYRRGEAAGIAGRLYDRLCSEFGRDAIFMDVDAMKPGEDFAVQLDQQIASSAILLALIGPSWVETIERSGNRRNEAGQDFVRSEIASALKRKIPVVPVLLDGATVPSDRQLPDDLKALSRRHALELRHSRFAADAASIVDAVKAAMPARRSSWAPQVAATLAIILGGAASAWHFGVLDPMMGRAGVANAPGAQATQTAPKSSSPAKSEPPKQADKPDTKSASAQKATEEKRPAPSPQWRAFTLQVKIDEPRADDPLKRGWLGVQIANMSREVEVALGMTAGSGTIVNSVFANGPAARAGIQPGDIIVSAARKPTPAARDLAVIVSDQKLGTTIPVSIWRLGNGIEDFNAALEKEALGGNALAMAEYGTTFSTGRGVPQNYVTAKTWFEKAAAAGDASALNKLGSMYANGNGVSPDMAIARQWYEKAAERGDANSIAEVARFHLDGLGGLPADAVKAREWNEKAAALGNSGAQYALARLMQSGRGGPKNEAEALRLYRLASDQGHQQAKYNLASMIELGN